MDAKGMGHAELLALLKGSELLSGLLDEDLDYVAESSELFALPSGGVLFGPGERAKRFYLVRSGEIGAFRAEDPERQVARFVQGDAVGDFDFAAGAVPDAECRALCPAELVAFPRRGLGMQDLARERPDASARILLRCLSMISARLRSTQRLISENAPWVRELKRQLYTDASTGLHSRAFLDEELPRLIEAPTALVLLKPDRFKELNDAHGHGAGDEAMSLIAGILVRETEALGRGWALRLRSNETALVVPRSGREEAAEIARRLAAAVAALELPCAAGTGFAFTSSLALAVWPEDGANWRRLVEGAYGLLTKAWRDGGARAYRLKPREEARP